jgi:hypothetical protein
MLGPEGAACHEPDCVMNNHKSYRGKQPRVNLEFGPGLRIVESGANTDGDDGLIRWTPEHFLEYLSEFAERNVEHVKIGSMLTFSDARFKHLFTIIQPHILHISDLAKLEHLKILQYCTCVTSLVIAGGQALKTLDGVQHLCLTNMSIEGCDSLVDIEYLQRGPYVKKLSMTRCSSLAHISGNGCFSKTLEKLILSGMNEELWGWIITLQGLKHLEVTNNHVDCIPTSGGTSNNNMTYLNLCDNVGINIVNIPWLFPKVEKLCMWNTTFITNLHDALPKFMFLQVLLIQFSVEIFNMMLLGKIPKSLKHIAFEESSVRNIQLRRVNGWTRSTNPNCGFVVYNRS